MILHIDQIRIRVNGRDKMSVDGNLYFSIGDVYFPEYQWFDMISIDFENWIPQILSFAEGHTDFCVFTFMDGPYLVKLIRQQPNVVTAVCLEKQNELITLPEIDFSRFLSSVAKCVNKLGTTIYKYDTQLQFEPEISQLGALSKKLRILAKGEVDCYTSVRTGSQ